MNRVLWLERQRAKPSLRREVTNQTLINNPYPFLEALAKIGYLFFHHE